MAEETTNVEKKKVILSGIQTSGKITIGNICGAIKNWVEMQDEYRCYYFLADLHSITVRQEPAELRKNTLDIAAILLAAGIDPEKSVLFMQSMVHEHAELAWVLNCYTGMGELGRMTQFKDKSAQHPENINTGLYTYPILQAADILLYQPNYVPVGHDQKQHIELTRNLAERFNYLYSDTFTVPEPYITKIGSKIMSLQEPTKKMSKSDPNEKATIFVLDPDDVIKSKIKRAVTDSGSEVKYDDNKPGVSNLIILYHIATGKTIEQIEQEFAGRGYGDFKPTVADAVAGYIGPIRDRYIEIRKDKDYLAKVLKEGAEKASAQASRTLRKVYKKVGFVQF